MGNPIHNRYVFAPATEDLDHYANDTTGAGPVTLAATSVGDGLAHKLGFVTTTNESAITATITGTDADDRPQVEAHTLPNATTNYTAKYFKTVSSITFSATLGADTMDIGFADEFVSPTMRLNGDAEVGPSFFLDITGTINLDIQLAVGEIRDFPDQNGAVWIEPDSDLVAETADSTAIQGIDRGWSMWRLQVNSYSAGAIAKIYVAQPG